VPCALRRPTSAEYEAFFDVSYGGERDGPRPNCKPTKRPCTFTICFNNLVITCLVLLVRTRSPWKFTTVWEYLSYRTLSYDMKVPL
jgi:hypothetical protein